MSEAYDLIHGWKRDLSKGWGAPYQGTYEPFDVDAENFDFAFCRACKTDNVTMNGPCTHCGKWLYTYQTNEGGLQTVIVPTEKDIRYMNDYPHTVNSSDQEQALRNYDVWLLCTKGELSPRMEDRMKQKIKQQGN